MRCSAVPEAVRSGPTAVPSERVPEVLGRLLSAEVSASPKLDGLRFNYVEGETLATIEATSDSPMRLASGASLATETYFYCVRRGQVTIRHGAFDNVLRSGQFMVFGAGHAVEVIHDRPSATFGIRTRPMARWLPHWTLSEFLPLTFEHGEARLAVEMAGNLAHASPGLRRSSEALVTETIERLFAQAIGTVGASGSANDASIAELHRRRIRHYCTRHLSADLSPTAVAHALGISRAHLYRLFKSESTSLSKWIQQRRLEAVRAELLLAGSSQRTLTELALAHGFSTLAHFSQCFRNRYGLSPGEFRRASQRPDRSPPPL